MDRVLVVATAPTAEPISLAEAKMHLRVDGSDEDTLILGLIAAAREMAETYTRRSLVTRTYDLVLDYWWSGAMVWLPMPPIQSIASVKYIDRAGVTHTMPSQDYYLDTAMGRLCLNDNATFPSDTLRSHAGVTVRYVAGYGGASAVPDSVKAAMKLIVGHLYENRQEVVTGTITAKLPMAAESLLMMNRAWVPGR